MRSRSMPTPLVELPCGSASMSNVLRSAVASEAARFTAVVVLPTPPRRLKHQVVEVAGGDAGNPRGLSERAGPDAIEFLASFRRERPQLEVGKVSRQSKRSQLGEPTRRLALAR